MLCSVSKAVCFERWRQYGRLCCLSKSQLLRSTSQLNCKLELAGHKPLHLRSSVTACKMTSWSDPTSLGFLLFYVAFARKVSYITSSITHQSPSWTRGQVIKKYSLSPPPPPPPNHHVTHSPSLLRVFPSLKFSLSPLQRSIPKTLHKPPNFEQLLSYLGITPFKLSAKTNGSMATLKW